MYKTKYLSWIFFLNQYDFWPLLSDRSRPSSPNFFRCNFRPKQNHILIRKLKNYVITIFCLRKDFVCAQGLRSSYLDYDILLRIWTLRLTTVLGHLKGFQFQNHDKFSGERIYINWWVPCNSFALLEFHKSMSCFLCKIIPFRRHIIYLFSPSTFPELLCVRSQWLSMRHSSSDASNRQSFAVSYFIDTFGFSREEAASASKRVSFETPEKPDLVINFLNSQKPRFFVSLEKSHSVFDLIPRRPFCPR